MKYDSQIKNHYFDLYACAVLLSIHRQFRLQLQGVVLDTDGSPLAGVLVNHGKPNENMMSNVKTDEYGRFSFNAYEGMKYSARVIIDLVDSEYA